MGASVSMNLAAFKQSLDATAERMQQATRPAAQAGVQVIYERARQLAPTSDSAHMFYGKRGVYGPFAPGTLRDSIYQVFSKDKSFKDVSTYHVSWNARKAPYGGMVEAGTSRAPAQSFIGRAVIETRSQARDAMKTAYIAEVQR